MKYQIQLEAFQGPFDLLFHLIDKNEVDIYDIPIAEITQQYLLYLDTMKSFDIDIASEFLVMAATLLSIKAKMLLPKPPRIIDAAETAETDPRMELVEKLLEYKKYKNMALQLEEIKDVREKKYFRPNEEEYYLAAFASQNPLEGVTINDLIAALEDLIVKSEVPIFIEEIPREEYTVKEKMKELLIDLELQGGSLSFKHLFTRSGNRNEMIMLFLALLELIRLQQIRVFQSGSMGEIMIFAIDA